MDRVIRRFLVYSSLPVVFYSSLRAFENFFGMCPLVASETVLLSSPYFVKSNSGDILQRNCKITEHIFVGTSIYRYLYPQKNVPCFLQFRCKMAPELSINSPNNT